MLHFCKQYNEKFKMENNIDMKKHNVFIFVPPGSTFQAHHHQDHLDVPLLFFSRYSGRLFISQKVNHSRWTISDVMMMMHRLREQGIARAGTMNKRQVYYKECHCGLHLRRSFADGIYKMSFNTWIGSR